jgi:prephenate dehydratase/prephenate dehydrogenase
MRSMSLPSTAAVIGYGRFGQLWASVLAEDFDVRVHDPEPAAAARATEQGRRTVELDDALAAGVLFYCVPISAFEAIIREHVPLLLARPERPTLVDMLSVKLHPRAVFERHLPADFPAMLAHPMFGPDSVAVGGLEGQTIVLDRYRLAPKAFGEWTRYFENRGLVVVSMNADDHDRLAADSQGLTHFVGRTLQRFGFAPTRIDTLGTKKLHEIAAQVSNDTWQLFSDLQTHNPHTRAMRVRLSAAQDAIFDRLLPNRLHTDRLVVGIQGGRGSFNEQAAREYMSREPEAAYELVYLHTSENVLRALHEGTVDRGQFAIHNSLGGMVGESVEAMAKYRFTIIEEFAIRISHALMVARGADLAAVDTVMTHPQVLAQCRVSLREKYPRLRQTSGEGDLIDHAKVAELLGRGELAATIATMGSSVLAEIHGLRIIDVDLQDLDENFTSFLWVQRPGDGAR